jgi:hypothetical protein|tara:strand:- start:617 stop:748 length:132 start_codon:yes stop_codon:yes gene_type:complete
MIQWHKRYVEKVLKIWGISFYQAMWISFVKGLLFGGLITYYFI